MKYKVLIMPSAEGELEEAYQWISERAPEAAVGWYNGALGACLTLETFPERSPLATESKTFEREIRQLIYGKGHHAYRILFDVSGRTVRILHIRHGARERLRPEKE